MQKHHLLLHSSWTMSPFKVHLCCMLIEAVESEVLNEVIADEAIKFICRQVDSQET